MLFRSSCPSPNPSYRFWLLALTFRTSRPAFCGRLTSPVSPHKTLIFRPCFFKRYLVSQALFSAWLAVSPGFACKRLGNFKPFWPPALAQQALLAIILQALRRLRGAVLFHRVGPSLSWGCPFWVLGLTRQSSRPAYCGRLTLGVRNMVFLAITPQGLADALEVAKANSSSVWCGSDAIGETEYSNRHGTNLSRFIYPLSGQPPSVIEGAIDTISEHHPGETIWVESNVSS